MTYYDTQCLNKILKNSTSGINIQLVENDKYSTIIENETIIFRNFESLLNYLENKSKPKLTSFIHQQNSPFITFKPIIEDKILNKPPIILENQSYQPQIPVFSPSLLLPIVIDENNIMDKLATKYGTDKASGGHYYTQYYPQIFTGFSPKYLLEIGVGGGGSLKMWQDFL